MHDSKGRHCSFTVVPPKKRHCVRVLMERGVVKLRGGREVRAASLYKNSFHRAGSPCMNGFLLGGGTHVPLSRSLSEYCFITLLCSITPRRRLGAPSGTEGALLFSGKWSILSPRNPLGTPPGPSWGAIGAQMGRGGGLYVFC